MSWIAGTLVRLRQWLDRRGADERMDEEIRLHIELETEKNLAEGLSAGEARRRAFVAFGGVERHREELWAGRRFPVLEELVRGLRHASRTLRRSPGFTAVAILAFALGIGASTAVFSVLNVVLWRDLPVQAQDELVVLWTAAPSGSSDHMPVTQGDLNAYREWTGSWSGSASASGWETTPIQVHGTPWSG